MANTDTVMMLREHVGRSTWVIERRGGSECRTATGVSQKPLNKTFSIEIFLYRNVISGKFAGVDADASIDNNVRCIESCIKIHITVYFRVLSLPRPRPCPSGRSELLRLHPYCKNPFLFRAEILNCMGDVELACQIGPTFVKK